MRIYKGGMIGGIFSISTRRLFASVIFFLIYFIITSIGEKSAQGGSLPPIFGTWIAIIFMTPVGLFLSYKAANDSVLFDAEIYKRFFTDLFRQLKQKLHRR